MHHQLITETDPACPHSSDIKSNIEKVASGYERDMRLQDFWSVQFNALPSYLLEMIKITLTNLC